MFAIAAALLFLYLGTKYSYLIWKDAIQPVMTTWLLFFVSASLSFWTYWSSDKHSVVGNIGNFCDLMVVWTIMFSLVFLSKTVTLGLNWVEISCLVASGIILIFWRMSKRHVLSNFALQLIMMIAYAPLFYKLWNATINTESTEFWLLGCFASCFSLVPAFADRDKLAVLYSLRSFSFSATALLLILRINFR
jgi:hypothetical protein